MVLESTTFWRRMEQAVVEEQQVSVVEYAHIMLKAEAAQRIAHDGELIVPSSELPQHSAGLGIHPHDLTKSRERNDVISVAVNSQRIRMIEIDARVRAQVGR